MGAGAVAFAGQTPDAVGDGHSAALCAYVTHWRANGVSVLDVGAREWRGFISVSFGPVDVVVRPDGRRAYVTRAADVGINGSVAVIDTATVP